MKRILARICLAAGAMGAVALYLDAESMMENSLEARFQLDLRVPDAALATFFPMGWTPNVAAQGSNRLVYLVAPMKDPTGANVQLVIGGLTEDPADAPGPFGA